ncbi:MAG: HepT-like ribonuclease domain-containing protein, partial [Patescibacteria group bacterium]
TQILVEQGEKTPDTYRQSFSDLAKAEVLESGLARKLAVSAQVRNILVHEYDFEEDYKKFYDSAKIFIPAYQEYIQQIIRYLNKNK